MADIALIKARMVRMGNIGVTNHSKTNSLTWCLLIGTLLVTSRVESQAHRMDYQNYPRSVNISEVYKTLPRPDPWIEVFPVKSNKKELAEYVGKKIKKLLR